MANSVCEVLLTEARLEAPGGGVAEPARPSGGKRVDPGAGAIVDFWGVVRELEDGREIDGINYEAHAAMAEYQLRLIAEESAKNFELKKVIVRHRIGFVSAGEASLFLQVAAGHRGTAFAAGRWIVDELKKRVPIWKRPRFKADNQASPESHLSPAARRAKL
jgi:molybdopterin synthase catalytic subunit